MRARKYIICLRLGLKVCETYIIATIYGSSNVFILPYRRALASGFLFIFMSMIIIGRKERKKERKPAKNNPSKHLGRLKTFFCSTECFPLCIGALTHVHQLIYLYCLYTYVNTCVYIPIYLPPYMHVCIYIIHRSRKK